jgi:RimJ/RimL family protein N-acetyltransferase
MSTAHGGDERAGPVLHTERLLLRRWREEDREPFAALNTDPEVMAHFPAHLTRDESDRTVDRIEAEFERRGFGLWAVEVVGGDTACIGFIGLWVPPFEAHFTPAVEVGWRLARRHWGLGYAPEGAAAALDHGFAVLGLDEIVSMTTVGNAKSRRVMEKLGMTRDQGDDFDHPAVPEGPHRRHVLYRMPRRRWAELRTP